MLNAFTLQGERRTFVLVGYFVVFMLHVLGIYWWYRNDDLYYPLFMVPPKSIPPFWHAIFIILVNGMDSSTGFWFIYILPVVM